MIDNTKEYILCAAIWYKDQQQLPSVYNPRNITTGVVLCGYRHSNIIGQCVGLLNLPQSKMGSYVQGFLTSKNRFLDREKAAKLAFECGQVEKLQYMSDELFSEDIY